ncbi:MAG: sugar phosphate isomerase/epimerase [Bacteroidota bacterium]|nr:sugar phosphate isomerase/epimerase [Bacteroidota bacterium]
MINRRKFLQNTGALALGSFILPMACAQRSGESGETSNRIGKGNLGPIGLQLYSIRDVLEQDINGNLQKLGGMGYKEVESYPGAKGHYYGLSPEEFSKMVKGAGMELISSHVGSGNPNAESVDWRQANLSQGFQAFADQAAKTGQQFLTCSFLSDSYRQNEDDLKKAVDLFDKSGQICKNAGMQFAYHNHDFEFEKIGDVVILDYLIENTDPTLVKFELDMYWVERAGQSIQDYLRKYPNRFSLGHVKDMSKEDGSKNAVIGEGSINYKEVLAVAKENGMKHFFVEQETYTMSSMDSMKKSIEYLADLKV